MKANQRGQGAGASPTALRDFCLNEQPYRHWQGFYEFPNEIPGADVVACIKVAVVNLAILKLADAVVAVSALGLLASKDFTAAVICEP